MKCCTLHVKHQKHLESVSVPSGSGARKGRSKRFNRLLEESVGTTSTSSSSHRTSRDKPPKTTEPKSVTAESVRPSKKLISRDKSSVCKKPTQTMRSSVRSEAQLGLIKEQSSSGFWNGLTTGLSQKLWLPTETALQGSVTSTSGPSSESVEPNSWFSTTRQKKKANSSSRRISSRLFRFMRAGGWEDVATKAKWAEQRNEDTWFKKRSGLPRTKKIRIHPNKEQRQILRNWFGAARYSYNQALDLVKAGHKINFYDLRNEICPAEKNIGNEWILETPNEVRAQAVNDLVKAYKTNFAKQRKDPSFTFEIKYRRRKYNQAIYIPTDALKGEHVIYPRILKGSLSFAEEPPPDYKSFACRLILEKPDHYYLCIPFELTPRAKEETHKRIMRGKIVAIDPGNRTFATYYSHQSCGKVGQGARERIFKLCKRMDHLISIVDKKRKIGRILTKRRYRLNKVISRIRRKIKNLITELHWKTALLLVRSYDAILLPNFRTKEMTKRERRCINSKIARSLMTFSHYTFKRRLICKAQEYGKHVFQCTEHWTSKTCGRCGHINHTLGASEVYRCSKCQLVIDRDYNGARNIYLRAWVDPPICLC